MTVGRPMKLAGIAGIIWLFFLSASFAEPSSTSENSDSPSQSDTIFGSSCAYPDAALRAGIAGQTSLEFYILPSGETAKITVVRSSGSTHLDNAAVECVSRWRESSNLSDQPRRIR